MPNFKQRAITFKGVEIHVTGSYSYAQAGSHDEQGFDAHASVDKVEAGGVDITPLIEAAGWDGELDLIVGKDLGLIS